MQLNKKQACTSASHPCSSLTPPTVCMIIHAQPTACSLSYLCACVCVCVCVNPPYDCLTGYQCRRSLHGYDAHVMLESWGVDEEEKLFWHVHKRKINWKKVAFSTAARVKDLPQGFTQRCKRNQPSQCATTAAADTSLRQWHPAFSPPPTSILDARLHPFSSYHPTF